MDYIVEWLSDCFTVLLLATGILMLVVTNQRISKTTKRLLRAIALMTIVLSTVDYCESVTASLDYENTARYIFSWIGYTLRPIISMFFFRIVTKNNKKLAWAYVLAVINSIVYATTFVPATHTLAFSYSASNEFLRGPLGYTCQVVGAVYIFAILFVVYKYYSEKRKHDATLIFFCALATIIATVLEMLSAGKLVILNETILCSCLFLFLFLRSRASAEEIEEKELLLSDQRAAMVVQEIHPRFIYEVLTRISTLVKKDPNRAEATLNNLITYLKRNMETTDFVHPIPFVEELERVKTYVEIEQARLPNLQVVLNIEDTDFVLPALTVQQMVENSIQHGFDGSSKGTVVIKTFCSESGHTIIIQDDGHGFSDEDALRSENQGSRFGIANVSDRLERMVNGDINIVTKPGTGTTVMISIPNEGKI